MGFFDKVFGKKESEAKQQNIQFKKADITSLHGDNLNFKKIRYLPENLKEKITASTLDVMTSQLYIHNWTDHFAYDDPNDQDYQNPLIYFWKVTEPFAELMSSPVLETYTARNFVFTVNNKNVIIKQGTVIPWPGMQGGGEKYFCEIFGEKIPVPDLEKIGIIEYIKPVELSNVNIEILTNKEQYFYLADNMISFKNNRFYLRNKPVSLELAYEIGAVNIVQKMNYSE